VPIFIDRGAPASLCLADSTTEDGAARGGPRTGLLGRRKRVARDHQMRCCARRANTSCRTIEVMGFAICERGKAMTAASPRNRDREVEKRASDPRVLQATTRTTQAPGCDSARRWRQRQAAAGNGGLGGGFGATRRPHRRQPRRRGACRGWPHRCCGLDCSRPALGPTLAVRWTAARLGANLAGSPVGGEGGPGPPFACRRAVADRMGAIRASSPTA
jgi:hypothetical protein